MIAWCEIRNFLYGLRREEGQGMAEYAVILTVIAVVVAGVLVLLAGGIGAALEKVTDIFPDPTP